MKRYFAVSDVHSFIDQMLTALYRNGFEQDNPEHYVIICGDAFDRGEYSDSMLHWLENLNDQHRLVYVRGNHEDLLESCVSDIRRMKQIGRYHLSNGTVKTIASVVGCSEYDIICRTFNWSEFDVRINKLLELMSSSIDYFELGDTIFVHGWVPTTFDIKTNKKMVHELFYNGDWKEARWENGMEMFHLKLVPPNKTVVCGHWHTSFAWHYYENVCTEWGSEAKFDTYVKHDKELNSRIIALDACTAYSRKVNCVVFDESGIMLDNNCLVKEGE